MQGCTGGAARVAGLQGRRTEGAQVAVPDAAVEAGVARDELLGVCSEAQARAGGRRGQHALDRVGEEVGVAVRLRREQRGTRVHKGGSDLGQLALRRPLSAPGRASYCPNASTGLDQSAARAAWVLAGQPGLGFRHGSRRAAPQGLSAVRPLPFARARGRADLVRVGLSTPGKGCAVASLWRKKTRFRLGCDTVLRPNALALSRVEHPRDVQCVGVSSLPHHSVECRRALEAKRRIVGSAAQRALEELDGRLAVRQRAPLQ